MATYTKQPVRLARISMEVAFDAAPADPQMVLAVVTEDLVNDADPLDVIAGVQQYVNFDAHAVDIGGEIITADGASVTYIQLVELIKQAVLDRLLP